MGWRVPGRRAGEQWGGQAPSWQGRGAGRGYGGVGAGGTRFAFAVGASQRVNEQTCRESREAWVALKY